MALISVFVNLSMKEVADFLDRNGIKKYSFNRVENGQVQIAVFDNQKDLLLDSLSKENIEIRNEETLKG